MIPLRLVIDTNVVVSAALKPDGLQRTVLLLAITNSAKLYYQRRYFCGLPGGAGTSEIKVRKGLRQQLLQLIRSHSYRVMPARRLHLAADPDANISLIGVV